MPRGVISLHKLIGVEYHEREVNGQMEECVSIPLRPNGISRWKGKFLFLHFFVTPCKPNIKGYTHYLSLRFFDKKTYKEIKELGLWESVKRIGNLCMSDHSNAISSAYNFENTKNNDLDKAFEQ